MKKLSLVISLLFLLACAKSNNKPSPQGGQDSGGGNIVFSTDTEVEKAYNDVVKDLPRAVNEILNLGFLANVTDDEKLYLLLAFKQKIIDLVPEKDRLEIDRSALDPRILEEEIFDLNRTPEQAPLFIAFKKLIDSSEIKIKRDGPCSAQDNPHGYGSIKEFKIGSPICISFYKLKTVPKDSLYKEILGVLLHEYLHALNFNERAAVLIQSVITNNSSIASGPYYYRVFEPVQGESQKHDLVEDADTLKSFAEKNGKIKAEDLMRFCGTLKETSISRQLLYQKYSKYIAENKRSWLDKKIISESTLLDLELAIPLSEMGFDLSFRESLNSAYESCDQGKPLTLTVELKTELLNIYKQIYIATDAMDEIDSYLEKVY